MPLEDRLRDALHDGAASVEPDVEYHLALVRGRSRRRAPIGILAPMTAALAVLMVGFVVAFGGSIGKPNQDHTGASPSASQDPTLGGTYRLSIRTADDPDLAGDWELTFGPSSHLIVQGPDTYAFQAEMPARGYVYAVDGDSLFTNLFASQLDEACTGSGTYRWRLDGTGLAFEVVNDTCPVRVAVLAGQIWTRLTD